MTLMIFQEKRVSKSCQLSRKMDPSIYKHINNVPKKQRDEEYPHLHAEKEKVTVFVRSEASS